MYPPGSAARQRPGVVIAAGAIMFGIALLGLADAVGTFAALPAFDDRYQRFAAGTGATPTDIHDTGTAFRAALTTSAVLILLAAVAFALLAIWVLRGSAVARIVTWVFCGLGLLCGCCGVTFAFTSAVTGTQPETPDVRTALAGAAQNALPSWWAWLSTVLIAAQVLGYILVAVLLALPGVNPFFRAGERGAWQPPSPGESPWPPPTESP